MKKSPIRSLFETLCAQETVTVSFASEQDLQTTKVRLHQIRKELDTQLAAIGQTEGIIGDKSIIFEELSPLVYTIKLSASNTANRARFTILASPIGDNQNGPPSPVSTDMAKS